MQQSVSVTVDHDPFLSIPLTPTKRVSSNELNDGPKNFEISPAQVSSNKLAKHCQAEWIMLFTSCVECFLSSYEKIVIFSPWHFLWFFHSLDGPRGWNIKCWVFCRISFLCHWLSSFCSSKLKLLLFSFIKWNNSFFWVCITLFVNIVMKLQSILLYFVLLWNTITKLQSVQLLSKSLSM